MTSADGFAPVGCPHERVLPVLPWHPDCNTVDGQCVACGESGFVLWEAYGYADAFFERPYPTREEVLRAFDEWWAGLPLP